MAGTKEIPRQGFVCQSIQLMVTKLFDQFATCAWFGSMEKCADSTVRELDGKVGRGHQNPVPQLIKYRFVELPEPSLVLKGSRGGLQSSHRGQNARQFGRYMHIRLWNQITPPQRCLERLNSGSQPLAELAFAMVKPHGCKQRGGNDQFGDHASGVREMGILSM